MSQLLHLRSVELVPVLELEPWHFANPDRSSPTSSSREEWHRYWLDSLADAGFTDLEPLQAGSFHVPIRQLTAKPATLAKLIDRVVQAWDGPQVFSDPDSDPVLAGGLALVSGSEVLAEPTCCVDLRNLSDWRTAAAYRGAEWQILWIGHPWLSVRFEAPWLVISDRHESDTPTGQWMVAPDKLDHAVHGGEAELEQFSLRLRSILEGMSVHDAVKCARKLAGLPPRPVMIDPRWLTSNVIGIAKAIDSNQGFDCLPVLGDALLDTGCDHPEVLAHCRSGEQHDERCWLIDLLLEKN